MLSIAKISSLEYYESLAREDYYQQGQEPPGQWLGGLSESLGLKGAAAGKTYQALFTGFHPESKEPLVQQAGAEHRPGWDFCFSAPKSVSVVWALADNELRENIQKAQAKAVQAASEFIETQLITRRGKAGVKAERPASCLWAMFEHSTSRALDPQLHTHSLLANVCQREDGSFGTLEPVDAYRAKLAAGAIYRAELASEMKSLGFGIERDGDCFRLAGDSVLKNLEKEFSKRREEIELQMESKGLTSAKAAEVAALDSRQQKKCHSRDELFREWGKIGTEFGYELNAVIATEAKDLPAEKSTEELCHFLTYHQSTFHLRDVYNEIAIASQGRRSASEIYASAEEFLASPEIVRLKGPNQIIRYTTREILNIEKEILTSADRRFQEAHHIVQEETISTVSEYRALSGEQLAALRHIVEKPGGVVCVQGVAGAGKSYLMGACRDTWEVSGYEVIGAALAGKAAEGLEEGSGIKAQTLHSLISELEQGQRHLTPKTILVIDEAGMVGSRQMGKIMQFAEKAKTKVVLIGDTRQLQPVEAGAAFRTIQEKVGSAELKEIRRQRKSWAVQAVHDFASGKAAEGLAAYYQRGLVHIAGNRQEAAGLLVRDWWHRHCENENSGLLMIAGTRAEVRQLNGLAREQMTSNSFLGASFSIERQGGAVLELAEGDRVIFTRNSKMLGVKNGHLATIEMLNMSPLGKGARITARLDNGHKVVFDSEKYDHLDYGYAVTTHKAQGVTVDQAYVLGSESMVSRELAYVQMSRHRDEANIYLSHDEDGIDIDALHEAAKKMSLSRQAESSTDYEIEKIEPSCEL